MSNVCVTTLGTEREKGAPREGPALLQGLAVCAQCGEAWIEHHIAQKLEQITQEAREKGLQVEVVAF